MLVTGWILTDIPLFFFVVLGSLEFSVSVQWLDSRD